MDRVAEVEINSPQAVLRIKMQTGLHLPLSPGQLRNVGRGDRSKLEVPVVLVREQLNPLNRVLKVPSWQ